MSAKHSQLQTLRAALAISKNRFCIALHELQADDPYSIILEYDSSFPQPWSRTDVRRNISSITARPDTTSGDRPFVAVSDEGNVVTEKILGAGICSDDADGSGSIEGISYFNGILKAFGFGGQVYRRANDGRIREPYQLDDVALKRLTLMGLAQSADTNYAVGKMSAKEMQRPC